MGEKYVIPNKPNLASEPLSVEDAKIIPLEEEKFVVVHFEGGMGKHIAGTAVIDAVKNKHKDRKLVVVSAYPEIFLWNPKVWRAYGLGNTPYFYDDYIKDKDSIIYKQDPYSHTEHIHQRQHVIKSWVEVFGIEYKNEAPELYIPYRMTELVIQKYRRDRPILIMHTNGGPYNPSDTYNANQVVSWSRDMPFPVAKAVVDHFSKTHHIYQVCKSKHNVIPGVEAIIQPHFNLELISLLQISDKRILIDSCLQHAAAALKLRSMVLWNGTSPDVFGYGIHDNLLPSQKKMEGFNNIKAYLYEYELGGDPIQCPYGSNDLYNIDYILKNL